VAAVIVCLCHGVSDGELRAVIRRGASSTAELAHACGAGSDCGSCQPQLCSLLAEAHPADRKENHEGSRPSHHAAQ
jgi:bacterioferritin-associated ferredoxin